MVRGRVATTGPEAASAGRAGPYDEASGGPAMGGDAALPASRYLDIRIDRIEPNPEQPRQVFDEGELRDLATSIAERGVRHPILVRAHPERSGWFQLVAGERRWRATALAGLARIPALREEVADPDMLIEALEENLQRRDISYEEVTRAARRLHDEFGLSLRQVAARIHVDPSRLSRLLRVATDPYLREQVALAAPGAGLPLGTAEDVVRVTDPARRRDVAAFFVEQRRRGADVPMAAVRQIVRQVNGAPPDSAPGPSYDEMLRVARGGAASPASPPTPDSGPTPPRPAPPRPGGQPATDSPAPLPPPTVDPASGERVAETRRRRLRQARERVRQLRWGLADEIERVRIFGADEDILALLAEARDDLEKYLAERGWD